jgi:hypothetical protein
VGWPLIQRVSGHHSDTVQLRWSVQVVNHIKNNFFTVLKVRRPALLLPAVLLPFGLSR